MALAQKTMKSSHKETHKAMYACLMHPNETSCKEEEDYSKCGIKLVKTLNHDTSGKGKKTEVLSKYVRKMDGKRQRLYNVVFYN